MDEIESYILKILKRELKSNVALLEKEGTVFEKTYIQGCINTLEFLQWKFLQDFPLVRKNTDKGYRTQPDRKGSKE